MPDTPEDLHQRYVQQASWTAAIRRQAFLRFNVKDATRILEVGSGTGAIAAELRRTSHGAVIGLDRDRMVSRFAHRSDPTGACVTGLGEHLPFPNSSFDLVCCHYLLLWVDDPLVILSEMLRVTRPGGGVLCLAEPDYGGRVDHPGSLEVLGALQEQALRSRGAEPRLGRRLRQLLHQAGLMQIQTGVLGGEWAGVGAGGSPADRDLEWHTLTGDVKEMLSRGDLARLEAEFLRATQDGSRLLFVPTFYGWGTRTAHPTPTSPLPRQMG